MNLSPFTGHYRTNPALVWRRLLDDRERVHYAEDLGVWLISGHTDVRNALGDPVTFSNAATLAPVYDMCPQALDIVVQIDAPPTTAAADAPVHTRTRRALRALFPNTAPKVAADFGPIVAHRVTDAVTALAKQPGEPVDVLPELASAVPLLVICDILGVPTEDHPMIKASADGQIALVWGNPEPAEQVRLAQSLLDFWRYCQRLVNQRAAEGATGDDFISRALRLRDGDDSILTMNEVASFAFNLLVAGHETTAGLIAHSLDLALAVPARWQALVDNPDRVPAFVEETLRFGPPIDGWLRVTTRPVTIGNTTIPAGARCLLLIGAANRDQATFSHPDRFNPHRPDVRDHLSFGYGPHFCIGAALARLEAQTVLTHLTAALPDLRKVELHESYKPNVAFRAHQRLMVIHGGEPA